MAFHTFLYTIIILWFCYYIWSRRHFYKVYFQMPGPCGLPFIGLGLKLLKPEQFLQCLETISLKYKTPFISWLGTKCFLYVNDPATVETIFNSPHCVNKGAFYDFLRHAIGDGLFTSKKPRWNKHRRLLNPFFKRSAINNFLPIFNHQADLFIEKLLKQQERQQSFDLYELLKKSILQTSFVTTMGQNINFHKHNDKSSFIFEAYNNITEVCVTRMLRPWLYPNFIYHLSSLYKKERKFSFNLQRFVENLLKIRSPLTSMEMSIDKISDLIENDNNKCVDKSDTKDDNGHNNDIRYDENTVRGFKSLGFIQQMFNYIERQLLTWQDVRDEANVIVAATFETTSTALYFVCLCLAMHPECQEKLYYELVDIFTKCNNVDKNANNDNDHYNIENDDERDIIEEQQEFSENVIDFETDGKHKTQKTNEYIMNRLNEINSSDISNTKSYYLNTNRITIEQLKRMEYTEMVINEAMRLFAPVPIVLREASTSIHLNNGCLIPKGTQIAIDIYNMQRNPNIWGPLAKEFQPDVHFSKASTSTSTSQSSSSSPSSSDTTTTTTATTTTTPPPTTSTINSKTFAFIPFTKGLRMCIGYRYAMTLMKIMLAKIFSNFQLQTDTHLHEIQVKGTISLKLQKYPMFKIQQNKWQHEKKATKKNE